MDNSLIKRQAAIDAILAQSTHESVRELYEYTQEHPTAHWAEGLCDAIDAVIAVDGAPSAQPEIIHCRECKYQIKNFHEDKRRKDGGYYVYGCDLADDYSHVCFDDDFCSKAERWEGGKDE